MTGSKKWLSAGTALVFGAACLVVSPLAAQTATLPSRPTAISQNAPLQTGTFINQSGVDSHRVARLATNRASGKWYWEVQLVNGGFAGIGNTAAIGVASATIMTDVELGSVPGSTALRADGAVLQDGSKASSTKLNLRNNSVVMVALDANNGSLWFGIDGKWLSGDPANGTAPTAKVGKGPVVPTISSRHGGSGTMLLRPITTKFKYPVPKGFAPL